MNYYENQVKLRLNSAWLYKIHQQVDYLVQERLNSKLPYAFAVETYPSDPNATLVQIRSVDPLRIPGERQCQLTVMPGDIFRFRVLVNDAAREPLRPDQPLRTPRREYRASEEQMAAELLPRYLQKAGMEPLSLVHAGNDMRWMVKKPNAPRPFMASGRDFIVAARVTDAGAAESSMVQGIGPKRVFGFGLLRNLEKQEG